MISASGRLAAFFLIAVAVPSQAPAADDWANLSRYREANQSLSPADAQRVVFIGDSITEGWQSRPFIHDSPHFVGRGISGQTAPQMLVRFRSDVVALKPAVVHIMAGTNDIAGNTGAENEDEVFGYIVSMVQLARANGIEVVLASIPPAADFPWRRGLDPAPKIQSLNARLKAYARSHSLAYADYWSALASRDGGMKPEFSEDGVHPNDRGYDAMRATAQVAIKRAKHQR